MAMDPLSMKSVLDRVELLEKSYQEERLAVRTFRGTLRGASKVCPNALAGARGGAGGFSCPHTSAHDQGRHPPSAVCQSDV